MRPMRFRLFLAVLLLSALTQRATPLIGQAPAPAASTEHGSFTIHMILHAIGEEQYDLTTNSDGTKTLTTTFGYSDRGRQTSITATLMVTKDERPLKIEVKGNSPLTMTVSGSMTTLDIKGLSATTPTPSSYAAIVNQTPFALQMMMMRAWHARGEPKRLALLSLNPKAEALEIARVGRDLITVAGRTIALDRYTVNHLMFGREILWTTADGDLAAAMTFAGGLPLEAVRTGFESQLPDLYRAGVAQEMANLQAIGKEVPPLRSGTYAIAGATLIDATGKPPIADAVVVVRDNRIAAAGPRATTAIPASIAIVDGHGQTVLPGLWEMHTHASGVEFGPAHLAAGITTARDCGGEFDFLVAVRDAIKNDHAIGPRLLLAGLIDAGGPRAFGHVTAETPEEAVDAVRRYHAAGFQQMKVYTYLSREVVRAIANEAHRLGMTVTGHVPMALTTKAGIEAGMDQVNHLDYVTSLLRAPGATGAPDLAADAAKQGIQFLLDHHTVVDPTSSWDEMGGHSKDVPIESFEPGILTAPAILDAKFRGRDGNATADQMHAQMAQNEAVIIALFRAGVPIVPGSDTGLVAFGLHRELEIYVEAGMTPLEAIQAATIVSARAMGLDTDSGTVEPGKRADLILVDGDPLKDIRNLRKVTRVIVDGRVYDAPALWRSVGFHPASR
jgi:imidazolonepropionase-like amidohydrolase